MKKSTTYKKDTKEAIKEVLDALDLLILDDTIVTIELKGNPVKTPKKTVK